MEYRIVLNRMEFRAFHGCYDLEQQVGNRFTVDLEITAEPGEVASEDCVEKSGQLPVGLRNRTRTDARHPAHDRTRVDEHHGCPLCPVSANPPYPLYGFEGWRPRWAGLEKSERRAGEINHTATTNKARGIDSSRFIFLPDGIITTARKRSVRNTLPSLLLLREPSTPFAARKFPTP